MVAATGLVLVLTAILICSLEFAVGGTQASEGSTAPGKPASSFSDSIPDVRVADDRSSVRLFDGAERDKVLPLLEAGRSTHGGELVMVLGGENGR